MSFGFSLGDGIQLVQLAGRAYKGAQKACGAHAELTRELSSLKSVLRLLHEELANPESLLNRADEERKQEFNSIVEGCEGILKIIESTLTKYNGLSGDEKRRRPLWQKIKFGNGEVRDLRDLRSNLVAHTTAISMTINLCWLGSQGRAEKELRKVRGDLAGITENVEWVAANMTAKDKGGTIWTSHTNDDKMFWRELRRGLVQEGYGSSVLEKHKGAKKLTSRN